MKATIGAIEIEYETLGDQGGRPLLLVMGLASQLTAWPDEFCQGLVDRGYHVIRFDNRDIGLSTHLDGVAVAPPPYTLDDMADDAAGLLDHLGIGAADVVGVSMGGMIAQLLAIRHPERVLSLTSIMSNLGGEDVAMATPEAVAALMALPPDDRAGQIDHAVKVRRVLAGGNPIDEDLVRREAARSIDRSSDRDGVQRQLAAIMAAPSRREALAAVAVPALVIHGVDDPLVPAENGRRTAAALPGARLLEVEGMGHNLPATAWPVIFEAIEEVSAAAVAAA